MCTRWKKHSRMCSVLSKWLCEQWTKTKHVKKQRGRLWLLVWNRAELDLIQSNPYASKTSHRRWITVDFFIHAFHKDSRRRNNTYSLSLSLVCDSVIIQIHKIHGDSEKRKRVRYNQSLLLTRSLRLFPSSFPVRLH